MNTSSHIHSQINNVCYKEDAHESISLEFNGMAGLRKDLPPGGTI